MKAIDFSRVIEYYMHMNNTSVTPILLTYIEHLVLAHSPTHRQDVTQSSQLQSALIYLVFASSQENCRNPGTVASLTRSIQQSIQQQPAMLAPLLEKLFESFYVPQCQLPTLLDVLQSVLVGEKPDADAVDAMVEACQKAVLRMTKEEQLRFLAVLKSVIHSLAKSSLSSVFWRVLCGLVSVYESDGLIAWITEEIRRTVLTPKTVAIIEASIQRKEVQEALLPYRQIFGEPQPEECVSVSREYKTEECASVPREYKTESYLRALKTHELRLKRSESSSRDSASTKKPAFAAQVQRSTVRECVASHAVEDSQRGAGSVDAHTIVVSVGEHYGTGVAQSGRAGVLVPVPRGRDSVHRQPASLHVTLCLFCQV